MQKAEGGQQQANKGEPRASATGGQEQKAEGGTAKAENADLKLHYRGQVVDPDGKPVAGAKVFFVHWIQGAHPDGSAKPLAITDAEGWFDFAAQPPSSVQPPTSKQWLSVPIVASAAGFGPAVAESVNFETTGEGKKNLSAPALDALRQHSGDQQPVLKLVKDDVPLTGRVIDTEGNPVAGVRLRVNELMLGRNGSLDAWEKAAKEPKADFPALYREVYADVTGPQLPAIIADTQTDRDGKFTVHGIGRERLAQLLISGSGIESKFVLARTRAGEKVAVPLHFGLPKGVIMNGRDVHRGNLLPCRVHACHRAVPTRGWNHYRSRYRQADRQRSW